MRYDVIGLWIISIACSNPIMRLALVALSLHLSVSSRELVTLGLMRISSLECLLQ